MKSTQFRIAEERQFEKSINQYWKPGDVPAYHSIFWIEWKTWYGWKKLTYTEYLEIGGRVKEVEFTKHFTTFQDAYNTARQIQVMNQPSVRYHYNEHYI
jgi:hypothetical protein